MEEPEEDVQLCLAGTSKVLMQVIGMALILLKPSDVVKVLHMNLCPDSLVTPWILQHVRLPWPHYLQSLFKFMPIELMMGRYLSLFHPLLLLLTFSQTDLSIELPLFTSGGQQELQLHYQPFP